jgi:anaerobic ribonucleoside-triphosphate reductase activating protein
VTGGEPFDQPEALTYILEGLRRLGEASEISFDVLCYTGLHYGEVSRRFAHVLEFLDAIVSEPFEQNLPTKKYLCGSDNQVLRILSEKGRERFERGERRLCRDKQMSVSVGDDAVYITGIPREHDLDKLRKALASRGVNLGKVSWRE